MADRRSMTNLELVRSTLLDQHRDFIKEAVEIVAAELMDAEITAQIGAALGEVAPESRATHRNGYRSRAWETRVGEIELAIPKKRSGGSYLVDWSARSSPIGSRRIGQPLHPATTTYRAL